MPVPEHYYSELFGAYNPLTVAFPYVRKRSYFLVHETGFFVFRNGKFIGFLIRSISSDDLGARGPRQNGRRVRVRYVPTFPQDRIPSTAVETEILITTTKTLRSPIPMIIYNAGAVRGRRFCFLRPF